MQIAHTIRIALLSISVVNAAESVTQLEPALQLDLKPALASRFSYPVYIGAFGLTGKTLQLLVSPSVFAPGKQAILEVDTTGRVARVVPLDFDVDPRWLQVDNGSETVFVWKRAHPIQPNVTEKVYRIGRDAKVVEEASFTQRVRYPARLGAAPNGCIRQGATAETRGCNISAADPNERISMYRPLSAVELVSVEPSTPTLVILSPERGDIVMKRIMSPEIQRALNKYRTDTVSAVIVNDLTVVSDQHVLVSVTAQPLTGGAAILRVNLDQSFRCPLAQQKAFESSGNPQGLMFPSLIGYADSTLFVLDRRGMLAGCRMPLQHEIHQEGTP